MKFIRFILAVILLSAGMTLLIFVDWKICVGVVLLIWGNNMYLTDKKLQEVTNAHERAD